LSPWQRAQSNDGRRRLTYGVGAGAGFILMSRPLGDERNRRNTGTDGVNSDVDAARRV
jgi:hypothetical protein